MEDRVNGVYKHPPDIKRQRRRKKAGSSLAQYPRISAQVIELTGGKGREIG